MPSRSVCRVWSEPYLLKGTVKFKMFFHKISFIEFSLKDDFLSPPCLKRNDHRRCFVQKGVPKNFANFIVKKTHVFGSLFYKIAGLGLLKRDSNTGIFLWNLRISKKHLFWKTSGNNCFCLNFRKNKLRSNSIPCTSVIIN